MIVKILAFLANPWFEAGTPREVIDKYRTDQEFHQRLLKETATGQRIIMAFGEDMFKKIYWDNACPSVVDHPRKKSPLNQIHVDRVITEQKPHLIIAFGDMANEAVRASVAAVKKKCMFCHHPNARFRTQSELDQFAQEVWDYILIHERKDEFTKHDKE